MFWDVYYGILAASGTILLIKIVCRVCWSVYEELKEKNSER